MKNTITNTSELFNKLAITTWDTIGNAFEHRISYGEDAITSVNLLSLKNASLPNILITDTRAKESEKGCDFEFWVGDNRKGWFRYAIQAKKISVKRGRYDSLNHKVGTTQQIDILEKYAEANNAIPLYCLFNYSKLNLITKIPCPKLIDIKEFGCSVTPSPIAKLSISTKGGRTFKWFHSKPETLPWSCLVRCPKINLHWEKCFTENEYISIKPHNTLPENLSNLFVNPNNSFYYNDTSIFSNSIDYRPRWIGVVNTEEENFE